MSSNNNNTNSPDAKKPCKGILKSSSSFDKQGTSSGTNRKSAKFDELNVLQTYHPADKDYGHMKVDEPKTPFNYDDPDIAVDELDANLLAEKLKEAAKTRPSHSRFSSNDVSIDEDDDDDDEEDENETEEQKQKRQEFLKHRKEHYNEFEAIRLARKLIEEEDEDDDDVQNQTRDK